MKSLKNWRILLMALSPLVVAVAVAVLGSTVHAQSPSSELRLSNSGLPISLVASPGSTVTTDIRIRNEGTSTETLKTGLMKFAARGEEGTPELVDREAGDDYFDWVSMSPSEFTILPNEYKTVRVSINVPSSAAFGYYYAVTFSRKSDEKPAKGQTVKGALATLVLLEARVPGAKRELQVVDFSSDKQLYDFLPATFKVKIKNTGNVHAVPHGDVTINQGNTELARMNINPGQGYILPGSNRVFTVQWNDGFPRTIPKVDGGKEVIDDKGQPVTQFDMDWSKVSKFRLGEYTANMLMIYDDGQKDVPVERSATFHVIPWLVILIVGAILVLIAVGIVTDFIKFERFLFRKGGKRSVTKSAARSTTRPAAKPKKKTTATKTTRKKSPTTRKK